MRMQLGGVRGVLVRYAVVALSALAVSGPTSAGEVLRVGTEGAYPPFNDVGPDGELKGFDIDIAKALCAAMGRECEFVTKEWNRIIEGLRTGEYDCIVASMSITLGRTEKVDFTDPYYKNKLRFVAAEDRRIAPTEASLEGLTVGAQAEAIAAQWLEQNMRNAVDIRRFDTQEQAYDALAAGKVDAVLADMLVSYYWLQSEEGSAFEFKGDSVYSGDRIAIAVRKDDDELKRELDRALDAIQENGTYRRIRERYFPFEIM